MEDTVATRLKLFIDTSGFSVSEFADMCGIPRPTLSQLLTGRNKKVSDVLVGQIHRTFPDLSVLWLLFGEGPVKINPLAYDRSSGGSIDLNRNSSEDNLNPARTSTYDTISSSGRDQSIGADSERTNEGNNSEIRGEGGANSRDSNLRALNQLGNEDNALKNQIFTSDLKIQDLQGQIAQMRKNPRRVLQITIYYDDSTFETFFPK